LKLLFEAMEKRKNLSFIWLVGLFITAITVVTVVWQFLRLDLNTYLASLVGAIAIAATIYGVAKTVLAKPVQTREADTSAPQDTGAHEETDSYLILDKHSDHEKESVKRSRQLRDYVDMGRLLMRSGRHDEAIDVFEKAISLEPENAKVYNYLGIAHGRIGNFQEAVQAYSKAISIDLDYASAHFNLASIFEQSGRDEEALEEWRRYVEIGEVVGEREDMLARARERIKQLGKRIPTIPD